VAAESGRRTAAIALIIVSVLAGGLVLATDAGRAGWPQPDLQPGPPYHLFALVVGVGLLVLSGVAMASRHAPRPREYVLLLVLAVAATWLSTYREGGAQQCCETGWIFGYGYPFEHLFGGVAPLQRVSRETAEAYLMEYEGADEIEPLAATGNVLFWGYAALLAYLPVRFAVLRVRQWAQRGQPRQCGER
jgi:hypothetical protein